MDSASTVGISLSELSVVAGVIVGALWALGKIGLTQFRVMVDERFQTIDNKLRSFDPLHGELARVDKDLLQVRLEMSQQYVRSDGLQRLDDKISRLFSEVFDKLDAKADKAECQRHHQ